MWPITKRIRFQDEARTPLLLGCRKLARVLAATLGPTGRAVAIDRVLKTGAPEVLTSGALIARRTFRLADPFENAGAMLLRHAVWRVYERTGDGSATTAVLVARLLEELARLLAANLSPQALQRGLERAEDVVRYTLPQLARPIQNAHELGTLLRPLELPEETSRFLLEALEALGPDGIVLVDPDESTTVRVELVQGVQWQSRLLAPELAPLYSGTQQLLEPAILLTDWKLEQAEHVLPVLETCLGQGTRSLFLVAEDLAGQALATVRMNVERGILQQVAAVAAPSVGLQQIRILEDLAAIVGGRAICRLTGGHPARIKPGDLGRARQVLVTRWTFALLGGRGDFRRIQQRSALAEAEQTSAEDDAGRRRAQERLARLRGAFLRLRVGGHTPTERDYRMTALEAITRTIQTALASGLLPGGGISLVTVAREIMRLESSVPPEERAALRAVRLALLEPFRTLTHNAGCSSGSLLHHACQVAPREVYDVLSGCWVDPWATHLLDPLGVLEAAVGAMFSTGRMFLSTDVLVRRTWPASRAEP